MPNRVYKKIIYVISDEATNDDLMHSILNSSKLNTLNFKEKEAILDIESFTVSCFSKKIDRFLELYW